VVFKAVILTRFQRGGRAVRAPTKRLKTP